MPVCRCACTSTCTATPSTGTGADTRTRTRTHTRTRTSYTRLPAHAALCRNQSRKVFLCLQIRWADAQGGTPLAFGAGEVALLIQRGGEVVVRHRIVRPLRDGGLVMRQGIGDAALSEQQAREREMRGAVLRI